MKRAFYHLPFVVLLALCIAPVSGCSKKMIPSTNVKDTRENRRIVNFLQNYRAAVEKRSVESVMELVAADYADNMGSEDPKEYINYFDLKDRLQTYFPRILDIRLGMFVQHISQVKEDKHKYEVVFYFSKQVLTDMPAGEKWYSFKEVNRMILRSRPDRDSPYDFEIVSGI